MANCTCPSVPKAGNADQPILCLIPRDSTKLLVKGGPLGKPSPSPVPQKSATSEAGFRLLGDDYIKENFKLPPRALYLDPFRRPLITFPMTQETTSHFNLARKTKINQQILDGILDPSKAISAPQVFPYGKDKTANKDGEEEDDEEEIIYILQLPDYEFKCPVHNQVVKTPRFIWHSCKKSTKNEAKNTLKPVLGPLNRPKPWLLSRHTDFDLLSQW